MCFGYLSLIAICVSTCNLTTLSQSADPYATRFLANVWSQSVDQNAAWLLASGPSQWFYTPYWHNLNPCFTWLLASNTGLWIHMHLDYLPVVPVCRSICNLASSLWSQSQAVNPCALTTQWSQPVNPYATWLPASGLSLWIHVQLDYLPVVSLWIHTQLDNLVPTHGSKCNLATCQSAQSVDPYATWLLASGPSQLTGLLCHSLWIHAYLPMHNGPSQRIHAQLGN